MKHETRVLFGALAGGLPGVAIALFLLWHEDYAARILWPLTILIVVTWLGFAFAVRTWVTFPLLTLSNLLGALQDGDYSLRGSRARNDDILGGLLKEVNALGESLRKQRLGAFEARFLLEKVIMEIDVAIFAFDEHETLQLVNRSGERLLGRKAGQILHREAGALGLAECLRGDTPRILDLSLPGGGGRWELRRGTFREGGIPHQLVLLSDLTRTLHEEERQAWKRLVQILRHEMNNSLAPISSIADSLRALLAREPRPDDWEEDLHQGLDVIAGRSEALHRFIKAYSTVTRLPDPQVGPVAVKPWVRRVLDLEPRMTVAVVSDSDVTIQADADQLDQLLINLVRNAVDAVQKSGQKVEVGWEVRHGRFQLWVDDDGPGISDSTNLFVPFFTTKPEGAGIGLTLSRQIAEAHGGTLTLENHADARGCRATLRIPQDRITPS